MTLVIDKFSQKVAKKNEDSIANGVVSRSRALPGTFWILVSVGIIDPGYSSRRENKPKKEAGD